MRAQAGRLHDFIRTPEISTECKVNVCMSLRVVRDKVESLRFGVAVLHNIVIVVRCVAYHLWVIILSLLT